MMIQLLVVGIASIALFEIFTPINKRGFLFFALCASITIFVLSVPTSTHVGVGSFAIFVRCIVLLRRLKN